MYHEPIMVKEVLHILRPQPDGIHLDGTVGGGGHARAVAWGMSARGRVVAIDLDAEALQAARESLQDVPPRVDLVQGDWRRSDEHLEILGIESVDTILLDLGVSSHQLDDPGRGFSYHYPEARLDMRMDMNADFSAQDVVNGYDADALTRVLQQYGEEKWASRIARFIVERRPIVTVGELVETIKAAIPASARREGPHPARRTFQAIRMEVNRELEGFEEGLLGLVSRLAVGGRLAVLTFHSLEDRPVKQLFRFLSADCRCPPDLPMCVCEGPVARDLASKPLTPPQREIEENPRSRSAKLRAIELIDDPQRLLLERRNRARWQ